MKKTVIILFLYCTALLIPVPGHSVLREDSAQSTDDSPWFRNELIVKYKSGTRQRAKLALQETTGAKTIRQMGLIGAEHIRLPEDLTVEEAIEIFRNDPNVKWVEPNYKRRAMAISAPNDPFFTELWPLQNTGQIVNSTTGTANADIQALDAWETSTDCSNVIIAIIDSGVDVNHPDVKNNLWTNPGEIAGNGIDDDGNGYIDDIHGWNFVDNNNDILDSNDHGTHVAGVIAAQGNNSVGTTGVCWSAKIMILKFLDTSGTGSSTDEVSAIEYAIANNAKIINASFGESGYLTPEYDAIAAAGNAGLLFVAASGNQGFDNDSRAIADRIYPGAYDLANIIAVAASDQDDELPDWSVYGLTTVDLAAPGVNIYGPYPDRQTVWSSTFDSGTNGWSLTGTWARVSGYLTDSPNTNYTINSETTATSPMIDLSDSGGTMVLFSIRGSSDSSSKLYLETRTSLVDDWTNQKVEIVSHSGTTTHYENGISGTYTLWSDAIAMITEVDNTTSAYIRFRFKTGSVSDSGWSIDDVIIKAVDTDYPAPATDHYQYLSGTSAATPMVSGAAGILWSRTPGLSYSQIKRSLINGVDQLSAFEGKMVSGGRLNLYNSLQLSLAETPGTGDTGGTTSSGGSGGGCFIGILQTFDGK